ncbi:hypothetical protein J2X65_004625 [Ancylobacter sp. 3268]|uniref:hypothetical protein n=1 Tax=Ancylobacter sp. 3268 TaxID=2817752 RepID=UPI00285FD17D|nr:hypothetical protein [Ancylobacter sp. 3268]MDR6955246.1 hypothetical protein [Ancylobacter sp. 3268]
MIGDKLQPLWSRFWHAAFPLLDPEKISLDELRRLELAAHYWHAHVKRALDKRQARYGRKAT